MPRQAELKTIHVVVLVLENHQNEILLTQRQAGKHLAGYWEFPGGKVEANETPEQALIREIQEEINFRPHGANQILSIQHSYSSKQVNLTVYHLRTKPTGIKANEGQPIRWLKKTSLTSIKLPEANKAIVDHLLKHK